MKTFQRNTLLMILVALGVVAMAVSTFSYGWLFTKVHNIIGEVALASEEVQLLSIKNAHTQTVRRVVRDTQAERDEIDTYFVSDEKLVAFLEAIEELSTYTNVSVQVQSVSVGNTIDKDELVAPLQLSLKNEGTLQEVFHTLALLEALPKALIVDSVRFTQNPSTLEWQGVFDIDVIKIDKEDKE